MKQKLRVFLTLLLCAVASVGWGQTTVTDDLTWSDLVPTSGSSYTNFSGKTFNSDAVYAGQISNGSGKYIQLRKQSPAGIVTTASGGKIKSVTIEWASGTTAGRTLTVYGKNTPYSSSSELYNDSKGTELGSFAKPTSTNAPDQTMTLNVSGDYEYVGFLASAAIYILKISIEWDVTTPSDPVTPTVTFASDPFEIEVGATGTNTITKPSDLTVTYSSGAETVATVDSSTGEVTGVAVGETTIIASWAAVENKYNAGSASYTVNVIPEKQAVVFERVTSASQLVAGNEYILVSADNNTAMGSQNGSYRNKIDVTVSDNNSVSVTNEAVTVLTLGGSNGAWTLRTSDDNKYLCYPGNKNTLNVAESDTAVWVITDDFQVRHGNVTSRYIKYNSNSGQERFSTYVSGQQKAVLFMKQGGVALPSISADNINIEYNANSGSFTFSISNAVDGGTTTVAENVDWISNAELSDNTVSFTTTVNEAAASREGIITLTYTFGDNQTVTKEVIVTQAGNPDVTMTIAEVRTQGTGDVMTKGVVTSCVGKNAYIQDATAAILVYGNSNITDLTVGDEIKVSGTLSTYHGLLEIINPEYTVLTSGNTVEPEVMTIAQVIENASNKQGWLVKIENATVTAIDEQNPTIAQGEESIVVRHIASVEYNVGDILTLTGNIGCYDNVQIANPQNVSVQKTTSITAVDAVDLAADAISGEIAYEINNPIDGTTLLASTSADWISNFSITTDKVTFTTAANTGAERTATITLTYGDVTKDITVTQAAYISPITGDKYVKVTSTNDITNGQYLIVYEEGSVAFNGGLETLDAASNTIEVIPNNNQIVATTETAAAEFTIDVKAGTLKSASGQYIGKTANSNGIDSSAETEYTNTFSFDEGGNVVITASGGCTLRYNSASDQKRFRYYKSGQKAIQLYKKVEDTPQPETIEVTIGKNATGADGAYYSSVYYSDKALKVPAGVKCLTYKVVDGALTVSKTYNADDVIPADEAVVIKASASGTVTFPVTTVTAEKDADSQLKGVDKATTISGGTDYKFYKLTLNSAGVAGTAGFYWDKDSNNGSQINAAAHKCYLQVNADQVRGAKSFVFGDETDGIGQIEIGQSSNAEIYNLSGQRVNKAQKGIYIVNGKKVVIR